MEIVIDANVLFSILIKHGKTEDIIFEAGLKIYAPEFLFEEFEKHRDYILEKTERSEAEFDELMERLKSRISTIPNEETSELIGLAEKISPDPNDADYFALALKLKCPIWSNDKELLKQNVVRIYSTGELIKAFGYF